MKKRIEILDFVLHLGNDLSSGEPYYDVYECDMWIGELYDMSFQHIDEETDKYVIDEDKLLSLIDGMR